MTATVPSQTLTPAAPVPAARRTGLVRVLAVGLVAAIPALIFNGFWLFLSAQVAVFAIATLGLDILYGRTGQLSLAHASFMGVGAYTGYVLASRGFGVGIQLLGVLGMALVSGALVAFPTLRLSGLRLSLVTLAFGELFAWLLTNTPSLTGGTQGVPVSPMSVAATDTSVPIIGYLVTLLPALIATLITLNLGRTQLGRRMLIVRDSETAARSVGVGVSRTKVISFLIAAVFAGVAGWLYGAINGFIAPPDFNLFASVYLFIAVMVGGAGSVLGAWLGAGYVVLVPQLFTLAGFPNLYALVGGALLAAVALVVPDGIVGQLSRARGLARRKRSG